MQNSVANYHNKQINIGKLYAIICNNAGAINKQIPVNFTA